MAISTSTVHRKLKQFTFKEDFSRLPEVLSIDEFSYQKGKLAFIAQDFETKKIITILENRTQTTIRNHFFRYSKEARNSVKIVTVDRSDSYILMIPRLFPKARIVIDRIHIVQHMSRTLNHTRIQLMKQSDKKSLEYRALKYYWRTVLKDSRKLYRFEHQKRENQSNSLSCLAISHPLQLTKSQKYLVNQKVTKYKKKR